jgi:hypothetical protein
LRSGWYIVIPINDVRVRTRFDLVATLFERFLPFVATCLGNFVVPAGLRARQISSLSIVARLSRGLELETLFLVRGDGCVGTQGQSVQCAFI